MSSLLKAILWFVFAVCFAAVFYATKWDIAVHDAVLAFFDAPWQQRFWGLVSNTGEAWVQFSFCVVMAVFAYRRCAYGLSKAWYLAAAGLLSIGMLGQVVKFVLGRPRPKLAAELYDLQWFELPAKLHSMPSGHTLTSFALLGLMSAFYGRGGRSFLLAWAVLVAASRVAIGAHYVSDVAVGAGMGYVLGVVWRQKFKMTPEQLLNE